MAGLHIDLNSVKPHAAKVASQLKLSTAITAKIIPLQPTSDANFSGHANTWHELRLGHTEEPVKGAYLNNLFSNQNIL